MVSRFTFTLGHDPEWDAPCVNKVPHASGGFVRYSDYEALRAEAAERLAGARVKALEWKHYDSGNAYARTPFLAYIANTDGTWLFRNGVETKVGDDLDAAKAAAQADYERRILSALAEPAGEAEPVSDEAEREDRIAALPYPDEAPAPEVLAYVLSCARLWVPEARIVGNARAGDIVRALTTPPDASAIRGAKLVISEIEKRFPNWRSYRDLIDCIDCTLSDLRRAHQ